MRNPDNEVISTYKEQVDEENSETEEKEEDSAVEEASDANSEVAEEVKDHFWSPSLWTRQNFYFSYENSEGKSNFVLSR